MLLNVRRQIIINKWTMTVPRLISEHDDGNYTCVVRNVHGLLQHNVFVEVLGTPPCPLYIVSLNCLQYYN